MENDNLVIWDSHTKSFISRKIELRTIDINDAERYNVTRALAITLGHKHLYILTYSSLNKQIQANYLVSYNFADRRRYLAYKQNGNGYCLVDNRDKAERFTTRSDAMNAGEGMRVAFELIEVNE